MSTKHTELLNNTAIHIKFPEDTPITIDVDTSFSSEDLSNGVANAVLLEAYDLAILSLQISREQIQKQVKGIKWKL